ncbi:MAG: hypothetical protein RLZ81_527 [Pseudomonadota bacterium]|jgi:hypothetical protein
MTNYQLKKEPIAWLIELGYSVHFGYDIAHNGAVPQRANLQNTILPGFISGQLCLLSALGDLKGALA